MRKTHRSRHPKSSCSFADDEMMGLGYFASSSSSSSSSSNLSPLAPPFTVERSNHAKLSLNPNLDSQFNGSSDGVLFNSPWPYSQSSISTRGLLADSVRTATVPSASNYLIPETINSPTAHNWSAMNSSIKSGLEPINPPAAVRLSGVDPNPNPQNLDSFYNNGTEAAPFYYPYALLSSDDDDDVPLAPLNEHGYDLFRSTGFVQGQGYGSSQVDYSQSLSGLKHDPQHVGTWSGLVDESQRKSLVDSVNSFFSQETNIAGSVGSKGYMNQGGAYHTEVLGRTQEDSSMLPRTYDNHLARKINIGPSVTGKSHATSVTATNHGIVSNGLSIRLSTPLSARHRRVSSIPSPELPKEHWNAQGSYTPYANQSITFDCGNDLKLPSVTKSSPSLVIKPPICPSTFSAHGAVSSKISGNAAFNSNDVLVSHYPLKEKESRLQLDSEPKESGLALNQLSFQIGRSDEHVKMSTDSPLNFEFKASSNIQIPNVNTTEDVKSSSNVSEHFDQHNPAEDSPCWKGAPSHFSQFGSPEPESSSHPTKKLQTSNGVNLLGSQVDHFFNHSSNVSSSEPHENNVSDERTLAFTPTEKDQKNGGVEVVGSDSAKASKGQGCYVRLVPKPRNGNGLLSEPSNDANPQISQLKLPNLNENVFISETKIQSINGDVDHNILASIENAANLSTSEILDVNVLYKALSNLSELLLLHCSKDKCGLKEQDHKALDRVISNLNECMSRKSDQVPSAKKYTYPQAVNLSALHQERNDDHSGKNVEKLQGASPREDDLSKDHNMVLTIKKVLDENLECEEDLSSNTLLYKNLWLEAEAELCAFRYRTRFQRAKREMDKSKAADVSEVASDVKKISTPNFFEMATKLMHEAVSSKTSETHAHNSLEGVGHVDDVENSVMTRFNILKRREESNPVIMAEKESADIEASGNEIRSSGVAEGTLFQHHIGKDEAVIMHSTFASGTEDVEQSVMARLNVLKSRGKESQSCGILELGTEDVEQSVMARLNVLNSRGKESQNCGVTVEPHFQHQAGKEAAGATNSGGGTSPIQNQYESGLHTPYSASSDWEHVLKDELS